MAAINPPPTDGSGGGYDVDPFRNGSSWACAKTGQFHLSANSLNAPTWSKCPCVIKIAAGRDRVPKRLSTAPRIKAVVPNTPASTKNHSPAPAPGGPINATFTIARRRYPTSPCTSCVLSGRDSSCFGLSARLAGFKGICSFILMLLVSSYPPSRLLAKHRYNISARFFTSAVGSPIPLDTSDLAKRTHKRRNVGKSTRYRVPGNRVCDPPCP